MLVQLGLILVAIGLNFKCIQSMFLVLAVALAVVSPIPTQWGAGVWYSICIVVECVVFYLAYRLNTRMSRPICILSALFITLHILGWIFDGASPDSPYGVTAKTLSYAEILVCILFSHSIINYIKERIKCPQNYLHIF